MTWKCKESSGNIQFAPDEVFNEEDGQCFLTDSALELAKCLNDKDQHIAELADEAVARMAELEEELAVVRRYWGEDHEELAICQAREALLRKALEFYATTAGTWKPKTGDVQGTYFDFDNGDIARKALAAEELK